MVGGHLEHHRKRKKGIGGHLSLKHHLAVVTNWNAAHISFRWSVPFSKWRWQIISKSELRKRRNKNCFLSPNCIFICICICVWSPNLYLCFSSPKFHLICSSLWQFCCTNLFLNESKASWKKNVKRIFKEKMQFFCNKLLQKCRWSYVCVNAKQSSLRIQLWCPIQQHQNVSNYFFVRVLMIEVRWLDCAAGADGNPVKKTNRLPS